eukprot:GHVP01003520.1.p1 GENE.GHVP01003520.1~~GHVP01003520.1.p1  ORF type:complete len:170 (+),score=20.47 GHVP01003520.1:28-537(+)
MEKQITQFAVLPSTMFEADEVVPQNNFQEIDSQFFGKFKNFFSKRFGKNNQGPASDTVVASPSRSAVENPYVCTPTAPTMQCLDAATGRPAPESLSPALPARACQNPRVTHYQFARGCRLMNENNRSESDDSDNYQEFEQIDGETKLPTQSDPNWGDSDSDSDSFSEDF